MADQIYKVQDPNGNIREISGPPGASDEEVIARAQELFATTEGGAVTGITREPKATGIQAEMPAIADIAGAGILGAVGNVAAPAVLRGVGYGLSSLPFPAARTLGRGATYMGEAAQAVKPVVRAAEGLTGGLVGEAVGKLTESVTENKIAAEASRLIAGGVTPTTIRLMLSAAGNGIRLLVGQEGAKAYARPDIAIMQMSNSIKNDVAQRQGGNLTAEQNKFIDSLIAELQGSKKPGEALLEIQSALETGAQQLKDQAAIRSKSLYDESFSVLQGANDAASAEVQSAVNNAKLGVSARTDAVAYLQSLKQNVLDKSNNLLSTIGTPRQKSEIGTELQNIVNLRNQSIRNNASTKYNDTESDVLDIVAGKQAKGEFVGSMPEYNSFIQDLKSNVVPGVRSADVAKSFQKILDNVSFKDAETTYQALDDARRLLGEVYRGRAPEGYGAIDADTARKYYKVISDIQKKYVGPKQDELLDNYAASKEGLEIFGSQYGKKLIARDPGALEQLKSDPASIPAYFFKSPKSFNSLVSLVGNKELAVGAARDYIANEISSLTTAKQINMWLTRNRDFLAIVPDIRNQVVQYRQALENSERTILNIDKGIKSLQKQQVDLPLSAQRDAEKRASALRAGGELQYASLQSQAETVTKEAAAAADMIFNSSVGPLKNVGQLILSGNMNAWNVAAPIISRSPAAKGAVFDAVRDILSNAPTKGSQRYFDETIAPPLLKFGMISKDQADTLYTQLGQIEAGRMPETAKLSLAKKLVLDSITAYSSSLGARGINNAGFSLYNYVVPQ